MIFPIFPNQHPEIVQRILPMVFVSSPAFRIMSQELYSSAAWHHGTMAPDRSGWIHRNFHARSPVKHGKTRWKSLEVTRCSYEILVGGPGPPLLKMMEFVNWDDYKPNINGKIKFMFQTTNKL